jgi:hypothetical protein
MVRLPCLIICAFLLKSHTISQNSPNPNSANLRVAACQQVVTPADGPKFVGDADLRLNTDGATATLLKDFCFWDGHEVWIAPKDLITDGASIPRLLWGPVGSPFTGPYRRAAILHDAYYADHRKHSFEQVNLMFYLGMIADGDSPRHAKFMYAGVWCCGASHWSTTVALSISSNSHTTSSASARQNQEAAVKKLSEDIGATDSVVNTTIEQTSSVTGLFPRFPVDRKTQLIVTFTPHASNFTEADLPAVQKLIDAQEEMKPGSMTLEQMLTQIRNFHPTTLGPQN